MRESSVEKYLDERIVALGGITRKWVSPGRRGVPDRIVFIRGTIEFVELKAPGGKVKPWQKREHARLEEQGATVLVLASKDDVDLAYPLP